MDLGVWKGGMLELIRSSLRGDRVVMLSLGADCDGGGDCSKFGGWGSRGRLWARGGADQFVKGGRIEVGVWTPL